MADLRKLLARLNLLNGRSLLQSGNLLFDGDGRSSAELEHALEAAAEKHLKLRTAFFVRTSKEWQDVVARNPFRTEAKDDPGHLVVAFLKTSPAKKDVDALQSAIKGREIVRPGGRHLYIAYPDGIGRSKLTIAVIEKTLGSSATGRNWNTVLKLQVLAAT